MDNKTLVKHRLATINNLLGVNDADDKFLEMESCYAGNRRHYQLTSHRGSRNVTELVLLPELVNICGGILYGIQVAQGS